MRRALDNLRINQAVFTNAAFFFTMVGFIFYIIELTDVSRELAKDVDIKTQAVAAEVFLSLLTTIAIIPIMNSAGRNIYRIFTDNSNAFPEEVELDHEMLPI